MCSPVHNGGWAQPSIQSPFLLWRLLLPPCQSPLCGRGMGFGPSLLLLGVQLLDGEGGLVQGRQGPFGPELGRSVVLGITLGVMTHLEKPSIMVSRYYELIFSDTGPIKSR